MLGVWGHLGFGADLTAGEIDCIAVDRRHNVYVGDKRQGKVSVLSPAGALLRQWSAPGVQSLVVNRGGLVYAAGAGHVAVYSSGGHLLATISDTGSPDTPDDPVTVALGPDDSLYVGDGTSHRVYKFVPRR